MLDKAEGKHSSFNDTLLWARILALCSLAPGSSSFQETVQVTRTHFVPGVYHANEGSTKETQFRDVFEGGFSLVHCAANCQNTAWDTHPLTGEALPAC